MSYLAKWRPSISDGPVTMTPEEIRVDLNFFFWRWYEDHKDDILIRRTILFWSIKIQVKDLHFLFVQLFGDNPYA